MTHLWLPIKCRVQAYILDYLYKSVKDFCELHQLSIFSSLEELLVTALSKRSPDNISENIRARNKSTRNYQQIRYLSERVKRIEIADRSYYLYGCILPPNPLSCHVSSLTRQTS